MNHILSKVFGYLDEIESYLLKEILAKDSVIENVVLFEYLDFKKIENVYNFRNVKLLNVIDILQIDKKIQFLLIENKNEEKKLLLYINDGCEFLTIINYEVFYVPRSVKYLIMYNCDVYCDIHPCIDLYLDKCLLVSKLGITVENNLTLYDFYSTMRILKAKNIYAQSSIIQQFPEEVEIFFIDNCVIDGTLPKRIKEAQIHNMDTYFEIIQADKIDIFNCDLFKIPSKVEDLSLSYVIVNRENLFNSNYIESTNFRTNNCSIEDVIIYTNYCHITYPYNDFSDQINCKEMYLRTCAPFYVNCESIKIVQNEMHLITFSDSVRVITYV